MSLARSCDVIVIGDGAAGTAAAVGAANAGAQTLLVESGPFLGGAATVKNILTYCGLFTNYQKKQAVFGVADQVLQRLCEMGAVSEPIQFHGSAFRRPRTSAAFKRWATPLLQRRVSRSSGVKTRWFRSKHWEA